MLLTRGSLGSAWFPFGISRGVLVRAARVGDGRPVGAAGPVVEAVSGAGPASTQVSVAQGGA